MNNTEIIIESIQRNHTEGIYCSEDFEKKVNESKNFYHVYRLIGELPVLSSKVNILKRTIYHTQEPLGKSLKYICSTFADKVDNVGYVDSLFFSGSACFIKHEDAVSYHSALTDALKDEMWSLSEELKDHKEELEKIFGF